MEPLCTHSKTCCFSAEVLDNLLQCLPLTRRRLLAKRFDQRCPRKFVLLREAYCAPDALAKAFDESLLVDDICFVCGEDDVGWWDSQDSNSDNSMVPGSYVTGLTMVSFEFFPFPELEEFRMDRAMCKTMEKNLGPFRARAYVCSQCKTLLVRYRQVKFAKGDVIHVVNC